MLNNKVNSICCRDVCVIFATVLMLGLAVSARGQAANVSPERGFHAGGSYALSDIETISRSSGELSVNIPLASLPPGRGGLSASLRLLYSSKPWDSVEEVGDDGQGNPVDVSRLISADDGEGNWHYGFEYRLKVKTRKLDPFADPCAQPILGSIFQLVLVTPDGGEHIMHSQGSMPDGYMSTLPDGYSICGGSPPVSGTFTYYTIDGTYLRLDLDLDQDNNWENNRWTLSLPDGTQVLGGAVPNSTYEQRIIDRNGNYIDIIVSTYNGHVATFIQDQLGRAIIIENSSDTQDKIHVMGPNQNELVWTVQWRDVWARKQYCLTETCQAPIYFLNVHQRFTVVDKILLPAQAGSLNYTFGYNGNATDTTGLSVGWGELSSITLPSGATATYGYEKDNASGNTIRAYHVLRNRPTQKTLTYNVVYDGVTTPVTEQWVYTATYGGFSGPEEVVIQTTTTGPDNGVSNEYPRRAVNGIYTPSETGKTVSPDGSVVERMYNYNPPNSLPELVGANRFVRFEFTSVPNQAGAPSKTAIKEYSCDLNGNALEVKEYDWVSYGSVPRDAYGQPTGLPNPAPTLVRVTVKDYYNPALDLSSANLYSTPSSPQLRNLVYSSEVRGGTALTRSEAFYDNQNYPLPPIKGNLTKALSWDSTKGGHSVPLTTTNSISVTTAYDTYGNVTLTTDARGFQTQLTYDAVGGHTNLYPTQIITAFGTSVARTTNKEYDFNTGLETRVTDADNSVATAMTYDDFGRATLVKAAENIAGLETRTATEYDDVARRVVVRADLSATADGKLVSIQHYDQLGRLRLSRQLENTADDPTGTDETKGIKSQTRYRYDLTSQSSYVVVSNPYRAATSDQAGSESTMGWQRTKRNQGGRVVEVQTYSGTSLPFPWGSSTSSSGTVVTGYDANQVTVTDQASKVRRSLTDGLGRLVQVIEDPNGANYLTSYGYDALDDLTSVTQNQASPVVNQSRSFVYTSLKRLQSALNPESSTVSYTYDENGNLKTKTDARSPAVVTTYFYDGLNRVTRRTYTNGTPEVNYIYDNQTLLYTPANFTRGKSYGRLVAVTYGAGSTNGTYIGSYDAFGRPAMSVQRTESNDYRLGYVYNLAGGMTSETYPSGRTVQTEYDTAGRMAGVRTGTLYYAGAAASDAANRIQYAAHGAISVMKLGNGKWEHTAFNGRLQPMEIGLGADSAASDLLKLEYTYNTTGQANNNGNVRTQTITAPKTQPGAGNLVLTQNYSYDGLNRLSFAEELIVAASQWNQTYDIDRWGNRAVRNSSTYIPSPTLTPVSTGSTDFTAFNQATNRLATSGFDYDDSGNLTKDPNTPTDGIVYDAENHQTSYTKTGPGGGMTSYSYDGDGHRVKKTDPSNNTTIFVYNVAGQLIAEYTSGTPSGGGTSYLTSDHLGSTRVVTSAADGSGNVTVKARYDYLPYGEEIGTERGSRTLVTGYGASDGTRQKFTQKERDSESGLDYFGARYYSSAQARFTGADGFWKDSQVVDPQSWNKYAYVRNNPLRLVDRGGEKATVKIVTNEENKTGTITISASIAIYSDGGSSFTQEQLNQAAGAIRSSIESAWSGTYQEDGITYTVTTNVDVQVYDSKSEATKSGAQNVIGISQNNAEPGATSIVNPRGIFSRDSSPDTGVWKFSRIVEAGVAAHEFTHLLGVDDRHNGGNISTTGQSVYLMAVQDDYRWALSGATSDHRYEGRQHYGNGNSLENRSSPAFKLGPPVSHGSTRELRAAKIWWN